MLILVYISFIFSSKTWTDLWVRLGIPVKLHTWMQKRVLYTLRGSLVIENIPLFPSKNILHLFPFWFNSATIKLPPGTAGFSLPLFSDSPEWDWIEHLPFFPKIFRAGGKLFPGRTLTQSFPRFGKALKMAKLLCKKICQISQQIENLNAKITYDENFRNCFLNVFAIFQFVDTGKSVSKLKMPK